MKKFFSALLILINLNCFAQASNWFLSFSAGPVIGGPSASLKNQMKTQGYGDDAESSFVIFGSGTTHYPRGGAMAILMRAGKKISNYKSLYAIAGVSGTATIEGFREKGYSNGFYGLFAGTYGDNISISYTTYQLAMGYLYSFPNTKIKLGVGPSLYLFHYTTAEEFSNKATYSSVVPGASLTGRFPFGKEKKLFRIEFVLEGNVAPPVKMNSDKVSEFQPEKVNMISLNAGLAFTFAK
jgi:hypothetical protein